MRNYEYHYINYIRKKIIPDAHKKHYGSYMSFDDKPISPGCIACKSGGWLCTFIGTKCNCTCPHCPNPAVVNNLEDKSTASMFGNVTLNDIIKILSEKQYYTGVAVSGGEPMLYIDKLVEWVSTIKNNFPHLYVWSYTNGLLATKANLKRLADAGLDELRFDLAADNYSSACMENMTTATKYIPAVGIEVPVILEQYNDLINAIDYADSIGIKYLNLHDLFINDQIYKNGLGGYMRFFDKMSGIQRDIFHCTLPIYKIFRHIKDNNLSIVPNDCTLINMQMQAISDNYKVKVDEGYDISFEKYMDLILEQCKEEELLIDNIL